MTDLPDSEKRRVIVCGPMTGIEFYNCDAFDERAAELRAAGHWVITPVELDREQGFDPKSGVVATEGFIAEAMLRNLAIIHEWATTIDLLPWWNFSKGAKIERLWGEYLGREIWEPTSPTTEEEAWRLVYGPKQDAYGDPAGFFTAVGLKWGVSAARAAHMMEQFKATRLERRYTRNDDVDRHGYALIGRIIDAHNNTPNGLTPLTQGYEDGEETSGGHI